MKKLLQIITTILAKAILHRYNPEIIGVAGSVGKTSAKDTIHYILKNYHKTGKTIGSFNTELGVPATIILGGENHKKYDINNYHYWTGNQQKLFWINIVFISLKKLLFKDKLYPNIIVLELGEDKPGDMEYLLKIVKPKIGILTAIGKIPAHVGFYDNPQQSLHENSKLLSALPKNGLGLVNADEEQINNLKFNANKKSFGFSKTADIKCNNIKLNIDENITKTYLTFDVSYKNKTTKIILPNAIAKHQAYNILIAIGIAEYYNLPIPEIQEKIKKITLPNQRLNLSKGIKDTLIIDDSYNSSLIASKSAINSMNNIFNLLQKKNNRVAILGDMLELGKFSYKAHFELGEYLINKIDVLITVGEESKVITKAVTKLDNKIKLHHFNTVEELIKNIENLITTNDLILVKGSRATKLKELSKLLVI